MNESTLFDKMLPDNHPLKDGINILLLCDWNIAGYYTYLMRAINKYSPHKARCIIWHDDQFKYDKDIIIDEEEDYTEINQLIREADFYFFGRYIFNATQADFSKLSKNNCLIKYHGSFLRDNHEKHEMKQMHLDNGMVALTGMDWSIVPLLEKSYYHIPGFFSEFGGMDERSVPASPSLNVFHCKHDLRDKGGQLKVYGGSGGSLLKQYDVLHKVVKQLYKEGHNVECVTTSDLPHKEFIEEKRKAHLCFSSLFTGGWGLSGVESFFMGQPVLTNVDPWILSLYPDQPCIIVNDEESLYRSLKFYCEHPEELAQVGRKSERFAQRYFKTTFMLKQHLYMIDLVRGGGRLLRVYDF